MTDQACTIYDSCNFDKSLTGASIFFITVVFIGVISSILILPKIKDKFWQRFLITAAGVLTFEIFTAPMWSNYNLSPIGYVYRDVSWILTLGWTCLILSTVLLVDHFLPKLRELQRFFIYIGILTIVVFLFQIWLVNVGIREYSPEVLAATTGIQIFNVPIEGFYFAPVFTSLIVAFYKYWSFQIDKIPLVPLFKRNWLKSLGISFLAVFLFELNINPMVENIGFPSWSYIFQDITIILTGAWVLGLWLSYNIILMLFKFLSPVLKFFLAVSINALLALPLEIWFIRNGYRVYSQSAMENFIGIDIFDTGVPIEIFFATFCYLALVIGFIRYFETITDNKI
jgi:hypothetical protein